MAIVDKDTYRTLQMSIENVDNLDQNSDQEDDQGTSFLPTIGKRGKKVAKMLSSLHEGDEQIESTLYSMPEETTIGEN